MRRFGPARRSRPSWAREIAADRGVYPCFEPAVVIAPRRGDLVIKPFVDQSSSKPVFRVETWQTHELIDGPFEHVRQALEAAFEFGVTARLAVWLDYTDDPDSHALDDKPLYCCDQGSERSESVA